MDSGMIILIFGFILIIFFDFTNGFHDAADMIATAVASMTMTPKRAILIVTLFTFLGPILGGVAVANTISGFVDISESSKEVAQILTLSALLAAISFNLITWKFGLPSSSSNSLTSGLVGAGLYMVGNGHINWGFEALSMGHLSGFVRILTGMVISPLAGFLTGFLIIKLLRKLLARLSSKAKVFLVASQYLTVSWLAFSHGTNDAQKGMGMMAMLLFASGVTTHLHVPFWVIPLCAGSMTVGTVFGGWNIIKTIGFGIYKVKIIHSLADQIGSALVVLGSSAIGAPVSTTQVVTTTLMGIGAGERPRHVRWNVAGNIFKGWLINIPSSLLMGIIFSYLLSKIFM